MEKIRGGFGGEKTPHLEGGGKKKCKETSIKITKKKIVPRKAPRRSSKKKI